MPKFLYSIGALSIFFWVSVAYVIVKVRPDTFLSIFIFLFLVFFAVSFTVSLPAFFVYQQKLPALMKPRQIFHRAFKSGAFCGFAVFGLLFLKAFDLFTPVNGGLFCVLCLGLFYQLK